MTLLPQSDEAAKVAPAPPTPAAPERHGWVAWLWQFRRRVGLLAAAMALAGIALYIQNALSGCHFHSSTVTAMGWNRDGTVLAVAYYDLTIELLTYSESSKVLSVRRLPAQFEEPFPEMKGHGTVQVLEWSPDGTMLLGASPYFLHVWDVSTGNTLLKHPFFEELPSPPPFPTQLLIARHFAWSPDSSRLAIRFKERCLRMWHAPPLAGGKRVDTSGGTSTVATDPEVNVQQEIWCLKWSPDGRYFAIGSPKAISIVDATDGRQMAIDDGRVPLCVPAWSPDSSRIAYAALKRDPLDVPSNPGSGYFNNGSISILSLSVSPPPNTGSQAPGPLNTSVPGNIYYRSSFPFLDYVGGMCWISDGSSKDAYVDFCFSGDSITRSPVPGEGATEVLMWESEGNALLMHLVDYPTRQFIQSPVSGRVMFGSVLDGVELSPRLSRFAESRYIESQLEWFRFKFSMVRVRTPRPGAVVGRF